MFGAQDRQLQTSLRDTVFRSAQLTRLKIRRLILSGFTLLTAVVTSLWAVIILWSNYLPEVPETAVFFLLEAARSIFAGCAILLTLLTFALIHTIRTHDLLLLVVEVATPNKARIVPSH